MTDQPLATSATSVTHRSAQWLREVLIIAISAAVGFGVAQYGDYRKDRELAARVLEGVVAEIEQNTARLEPLVGIHAAWVDALGNATTSNSNQSALDVYFAARPPYPDSLKSVFPFLSRSAWEAATSSGGLRLIEYDVAAKLSEIYRLQETATENVGRLANGALSSVATYDPAARAPAVRMLWLTLADIQSAESALLEMYRRHLPTLRTASAERK